MSDQQPPAQPAPEPSQEPINPPTPTNVPPGSPPNGIPPGYAPSSYMPPGYGAPQPPPGYGTAMPPPRYGYGVPQPPPAGYPAYPQGPYYPPTMFVQPPPREYAIPPAFPGQPWQTVPPAQGSLLQAWFSVGTKLSRQNIASWAQASASKRGWTAGSIIAYLVIALLPFLGFAIWGVLAGPSIMQNLFASANQTISASDLQRLQTGLAIGAVVLVIVVPLLVLASLYTITFFWALFMPPTLGTLGERSRRALRAYALVLPANALVSLVTFAIAGGFIALIATSIHINGVATDPGTDPVVHISSWFTLGILIFDLFAIASSVYSYALTLQAGSVGTTLSRWAVFGITLLASFVLSVVIWVIMFIGIAITSSLLAPHFSTTTSLLMPIAHATLLILR